MASIILVLSVHLPCLWEHGLHGLLPALFHSLSPVVTCMLLFSAADEGPQPPFLSSAAHCHQPSSMTTPGHLAPTAGWTSSLRTCSSFCNALIKGVTLRPPHRTEAAVRKPVASLHPGLRGEGSQAEKGQPRKCLAQGRRPSPRRTGVAWNHSDLPRQNTPRGQRMS